MFLKGGSSPEGLVHVYCNYCGSDNYRLLYSVNPHSHRNSDIVQCRDCGLIYVNPRGPVAGEDAGYFTELYLPQAEIAKGAARFCLNEVGRYHSGDRLLDVGCAAGFLLDLARAEGWEVFGVDTSGAAASYARKRLGLEVITGTVEEARFPEEFFDAVTMIETIEHMADPLSAPIEVHRVLKPKGLLFLTTPNIGGWIARLKGRGWFLLIPEGHLYYFTPWTISMILTKAGFEIIELRTAEYDPSIVKHPSLCRVVNRLLGIFKGGGSQLLVHAEKMGARTPTEGAP